MTQTQTPPMKSIIQLVKELPEGQSFFSYEFFPPKTAAGTQNLSVRMERMAKLGPLFVTVTWGAGGSTSTKSLNIATLCAKELGLQTCLHLTCTNMDQNILDDALDKAKEAGIKNILALRGDPPRGAEYVWTPSNSQFEHAIDLVKYIKNRHGDEFCIGVAAYPEGHVDGVDTNGQDPQNDIPFLKEKVKAGADFIITQLFYDVEKFLKFEELLLSDDSELFKSIPIIPGLLPINTYQSFIRTAKLSKASIPSDIFNHFQTIPTHDDNQVKQYGVEVITNIINQLKQRSKLVKGFHFYTLNLEKCVAQVLENANLVASDRTPDYNANENRVDPDRVTDEKPAAAISISTGKGDLGREATWDDFPNGRFGNSKSPAYGEIDGYGPTLHVDNAQALSLWGYPVDTKDINKLFVKHITNELEVIPWCDQKLGAETALIQEELLGLNEKGWWTVASQPATGASAKSTDKIFGWGPPGGHVFQKSFVEFFIPKSEWKNSLKKKLDDDREDFSYYVGDAQGQFETNLEPGSSNAVTWGVFPNREVVQTTIVEEESFKAWRDESFSIWKEWQRLYKPDSASSKLMNKIHDEYCLVSIVHHDYFNQNRLWDVLLE